MNRTIFFRIDDLWAIFLSIPKQFCGVSVLIETKASSEPKSALNESLVPVQAYIEFQPYNLPALPFA